MPRSASSPITSFASSVRGPGLANRSSTLRSESRKKRSTSSWSNKIQIPKGLWWTGSPFTERLVLGVRVVGEPGLEGVVQSRRIGHGLLSVLVNAFDHRNGGAIACDQRPASCPGISGTRLISDRGGSAAQRRGPRNLSVRVPYRVQPGRSCTRAMLPPPRSARRRC